MSSKDFESKSDKTVFRQAKTDNNYTVLKPTPGGSLQQQLDARHIQPIQIHSNSNDVDIEAAYYKFSRGLNPLVNVASVLLAVFEKTRKSVNHPNVGGLHQRLVNEIKSFETRARSKDISSELVLSARYVLCTILDEAVVNTPWGHESDWSQRTLLSTFHNEASGGEKFYIILDRLRESPAENGAIIELFYICLSLGFEGKYRLVQHGKEKIENIRNELFNIIRTYRGEYERELSPNWHGLGRINNSLTQYVPLWVVASVVGVVLLFSYSGFRYWLYSSSIPVVTKFESISTADYDSRK